MIIGSPVAALTPAAKVPHIAAPVAVPQQSHSLQQVRKAAKSVSGIPYHN